TFKEISSSGWTRKNDKTFNQTTERIEGLNNAKKQTDYENNYYTTYHHQNLLSSGNFNTIYHHQTCTGRVLGHLRNGTIISVARKCEELDCDGTNVRLSGDHILEIIFLKNITGRFRNYGNYCVSKKSIGEIKSGHTVFQANRLSYARRFYNESIRKNIRYREYRQPNNRREKQIAQSMKPIMVDGTATGL
ncbi:hypothetical protein LOAG_03424, partial [Loa loa]